MIDMPIAEGRLPAYRRREVSCGGVGSRSAAVGCWAERIVFILCASEVASYRLACTSVASGVLVKARLPLDDDQEQVG